MKTENMYYNQQKRSEVKKKPVDLEENFFVINKQKSYIACHIKKLMELANDRVRCDLQNGWNRFDKQRNL